MIHTVYSYKSGGSLKIQKLGGAQQRFCLVNGFGINKCAICRNIGEKQRGWCFIEEATEAYDSSL